MARDIFGQHVEVDAPEAIAQWNALALAVLSHGADAPDHLKGLLAAAPALAAAHALRGLFYVMLARRELAAAAQDALADAKAGLDGRGSGRERALVDALEACLAGRPTQAIGALDAHLERAPGDTLAFKLCHSLRFMQGDARGMRRSAEAVLPAHGPDHAGRGYALGCHAFALEETGSYAEAERAGRSALELAPDDAWGLHAVGHVYEMTARPCEGIDLIERNRGAWAHCNNFRYHVWWHQALFHIDRGDYARVLHLYDREIRCDRTDDYRDISNATSLLLRLELDGVDVGQRWEELADLAAARTDDGALVFADLHYLLALTGAGREADVAAMLKRLRRDAVARGNEASEVAADPGVAAASGLAAFGAGQYATAFSLLARARPGMQRVGGSHAQRDVFERITVDAGIRAGRLAEAAALLEDRRARRGAADGFWASRHAMLRDTQEAAAGLRA